VARGRLEMWGLHQLHQVDGLVLQASVLQLPTHHRFQKQLRLGLAYTQWWRSTRRPQLPSHVSRM
jgi:hypothetical protein